MGLLPSRATASPTTARRGYVCRLSLNARCILDDLVKGMGPDQTELSDLIGRSNTVMASLRPLGYKFVTFRDWL